MRYVTTVFNRYHSTNVSGAEAVTADSTHPRQAQNHRLLGSILILLLTSFMVSSKAQTQPVDGFQVVEGGMQVKTIEAGKGPVATKGMVATIHFISWVDNQGARGKMIYNTRLSGEPVSFVIGTDKVMPAWNQGVLGMQVGGQRELLVPPKMAYGNRAIDDIIPANASMQFIIELVQLRE